MKKGILILGGLSTLVIGSVFALKQDAVNFTRTFTLEKVDISILSDGNLENILPETTYDYHIQIQNEGEPCYVRILDEGQEVEIETSWIKIGDYYYYPSSIEHKEVVDFTNQITLQSIDASQKEVEWEVHAEAIQSKNFELDLSKEDPFDGVEIQPFVLGGEES